MAQKTLIVKQLKFAKHLQFPATQHHGSTLTVGWLAEWVAEKLRGIIKAPLALTQALKELARDKDALVRSSANVGPGMSTSLDNMNPRNRFLRELAAIPIAPGVATNSIIAV